MFRIFFVHMLKLYQMSLVAPAEHLNVNTPLLDYEQHHP